MGLPADAASGLLDGIDDAFRHVVHARYGGGIEVVQDQAGNDDAPPQTLRESHGGDRLRLVLHGQNDVPATAQGRGVPIGRVALSAQGSNGIKDVTVLSEVFDDRDPNEPSDATPFGGGVVFAPASERMPGGAGSGWLMVVRSSEATASDDRLGRQARRGWLARAARNSPGRALGLTTNGHRRAGPASVPVAVSTDLLARIGGAVASLPNGAGIGFGAVTVIVEIRADAAT